MLLETDQHGLALENYQAKYGKRTDRLDHILGGVTLNVSPGRIVGFIGPSGAGKTTLIRGLCGVLKNGANVKETGSIQIFNNHPEYLRRNGSISASFQDHALLAWHTVLDNVTFSQRVNGNVNKKNNKIEAERLLTALGLIEHADKYPYQLSGGMKQRVSFARALLRDAKFFALDEPLSMVDQVRREHILGTLGAELRARVVAGNLLAAWVSHSIEEIAYIADDIFILSNLPAKVVRHIKNSLPSERSIDIIREQRFFEFVNKIRDGARAR